MDWEALTARSVGLLRSTTGPNPDPRAEEVITHLDQNSPRFRELWARHDLAGMSEGTHTLKHPAAGELSLHFAHFPVGGSEAGSIFLYYAEPGSRAEEALRTLAGGW